MKSVVFGVFDDIDDARRVLVQLARSPLDLDAVAVVHADADVQTRLADEAGLPRGRSVVTGVAAAGVLGGALGAVVGAGPLSALGPLLGASAGVIVGAVCGGIAAAISESVHLTKDADVALLDAVNGGATVLMVRTANRPTARAIRDLFAAAGSRSLPALAAPGPDLDRATPADAPSSPYVAFPAPVDTRDADATADAPTADPSHHELFAPPWRRTPSSVRVPPGAAAALSATEADVVDVTPGQALVVDVDVARPAPAAAGRRTLRRRTAADPTRDAADPAPDAADPAPDAAAAEPATTGSEPDPADPVP